MLFYHHYNPQKHRLTTDFRTYRWTSYARYLLDRESILPKKEVFERMGGRADFIKYHDMLHFELKESDDWWIEEGEED